MPERSSVAPHGESEETVRERSRAVTSPSARVSSLRPSALPTALTASPLETASSSTVMVVRPLAPSSWSRATSLVWSKPSTSAVKLSPVSTIVTSTSVEPATTW
jgi:hypothetical protein